MKNKIILEEILAAMRKKQKSLTAELAAAPDGQVMLVQKDGKTVMQQYKEERGLKRRMSLAGKPDLAAALIRKRYAEAELQLLKKDAAMIAELLRRYHPVDYQNVLEMLPEKYRQFEKCQYLEGNANTQDSWMHMPYEQSDYHPEQKVHATSQGLYKWKMDLYESAGIVPWKNLIVTYEDENGFINLAVMEAQLKAMLLRNS